MFYKNFINYNNVVQKSGYIGGQHWIYYLIGAIFLILSIVMLFLSIKWRHSRKEAENYNYIYGEFKRFWQLNKFGFAVMTTIIFFICAIIFFIMNPVLLVK